MVVKKHIFGIVCPESVNHCCRTVILAMVYVNQNSRVSVEFVALSTWMNVQLDSSLFYSFFSGYEDPSPPDPRPATDNNGTTPPGSPSSTPYRSHSPDPPWCQGDQWSSPRPVSRCPNPAPWSSPNPASIPHRDHQWWSPKQWREIWLFTGDFLIRHHNLQCVSELNRDVYTYSK